MNPTDTATPRSANRHGSATVTLPSDREIVITRVFDAPAALVFRAWTTPELVRRWWGFETSPLVICDIDLRIGGSWRYVTRDPDGTELGWHGEYREIDAPHRIVSTEVFEGYPDAESVNTAGARGGRRGDDDARDRPPLLEGEPGRPRQLRHGERDAGHDGPAGGPPRRARQMSVEVSVGTLSERGERTVGRVCRSAGGGEAGVQARAQLVGVVVADRPPLALDDDPGRDDAGQRRQAHHFQSRTLPTVGRWARRGR